jgi:hypothetical protein
MAICAHCNTEETELYENNVPVCLHCMTIRDAKVKGQSCNVHETLLQDLCKATTRAEVASTDFNATMGDIPSRLPHPDGTQHISNTARELSAARKEMMNAHDRLNDFLGRGIVPEDLKRSRSS